MHRQEQSSLVSLVSACLSQTQLQNHLDHTLVCSVT